MPTPEQLAAAHWRYVESVLRAHGEVDEVIAKCGHHYRSAFVHGWKHAEEEDSTKTRCVDLSMPIGDMPLSVRTTRFLGEDVKTVGDILEKTEEYFGSSPRIWGTDCWWLCGPSWIRFIPTHMGNGDHHAGGCKTNPVHPHAYGERAPIPARSCISVGSSPRIWGTGAGVGHDQRVFRFIPTHMGNGK